MKIFNKKTAPFFLSAVFLFILDRFLKYFSLKYFFGKDLFLISDFFKFSFAENEGIAFSIPINQNILIFLIVIIILFILFFLFKLNKKKSFGEIFALTIILFGAVSNLIDRLFYGSVIDYFNLKYFTIFNLADVMIFCGVIFIMILNYRDIKN